MRTVNLDEAEDVRHAIPCTAFAGAYDRYQVYTAIQQRLLLASADKQLCHPMHIALTSAEDRLE